MRDEQHLSIIEFAYLHDLQQQFQREISELIDIYLHDARRKLANLHKALHDQNYTNFLGAIRELRLRSIDVGAIRFSYYCLQLEIAVQEMRLESVQKLIHFLEETFETVVNALEKFKHNSAKKDLLKTKEYS